MPFPVLGSNSAVAAGYEIDNSLRFNDDDSARLSRSQTNGNQDKWTWSVWVKRGNISSDQCFFATTNGSTTSFDFKFKSSDAIEIYNYFGGGFDSQLITNRLFRDPSAWYHIVLVYDSGNATESDRIQIYINGVEETSFSTTNYPSLNADSDLNVSGSTLDIGRQANGSQFFDGYMSDVYLIDGQALAPTEFGETNDNGVWIPKAYDGSYGTNGFFLEFKNSGALGTDTSGNGNNFTPTNLTATDQTTDTPTNNFMTMNPLATGSRATFSEGNIKTTLNLQGSVPYGQVEFGTFAVNKGKWYYEVFIVENGAGGQVAIGWNEKWESNTYTNGHNNLGSNGNAWYGDDGNIKIGSATTQSTGVDTFADTDIIGCAIDLDNNKVYWHKNGNYQDDPTPSPASNNGRALSSSYNGYWTPWVSKDSDNASHNPTINWNFGNPINTPSSGNADANGYGNFEYAVPSGYYALCTKNLAEYG